jgi:hypothetical protein
MARLTEYNIDLCNEICEQVSLGKHIKDVLDSKNSYPTFPTWCRWKREHDELFNLYVRSIQDKAEMVIFEINQTMNDLRNGEIDAITARVIIDTYKWMASKFYPKMFGDKVDITSGDKPLTQQAVFVIDERAKQTFAKNESEVID